MVQKVGGVVATQTQDLCLVPRTTDRRREQTHKSLFCDLHRSVMAHVWLNMPHTFRRRGIKRRRGEEEKEKEGEIISRSFLSPEKI